MILNDRMSVGGISQQFCVRWNSHLGSLGAAFPQLLAGQRFVDVTLACEGHQVHCHRLVLAACSSYFESLLGENPCKHPIIILPRDVKLWEVQALVDFMYKGEVNVSQAGLPDLLKCAEILQIRGLCGSDAALNLNQITNTTTGRITALSTLTGSLADQSSSSSTLLPPNPFSSINKTGRTTTTTAAGTNGTKANCLIAAINSSIHTNNNQLNVQNSKSSHSATIKLAGTPSSLSSANSEKIPLNTTKRGSNTTANEDAGGKVSNTKAKNAHERDESCTTPNDDGRTSPNGSCTDFNMRNDETDESDPKIDDDSDDSDDDGNTKVQGENDQQEVVKLHLDNDHPVTSKSSLNTSNGSPIPEQPEPSTSYSTVQGLDVDIIEINKYNDSIPKISVSSTNNSNTAGSIRVKSDENLFENYKHHHTNLHHTIHQKHSHKKIVDNFDRPSQSNNDDGIASPTSSLSIDPEFSADSKMNDDDDEDEDGDGDDDDDDDDDTFASQYLNENENHHHNPHVNEHKIGRGQDDAYDNACGNRLPSSLKFNKDTMTIYIKNSSTRNSSQTRPPTSTPINAELRTKTIIPDEQYENIVCSPNFVPIPYDDDDIECGNFNDAELNSSNDLLTESMSSIHDSELIICDDDDDDDAEVESEGHSQDLFQNQLPQLIPYSHRNTGTEQNVNSATVKTENRKLGKTRQNNFNEYDNGSNSAGLLLMRMSSNRMRTSNGTTDASNLNTKSVRGNSVSRLLQPKSGTVKEQKQFLPLPSAVVLRNPRGNQPRTYNTDALYAALMDVKSGESIYRASQLHKVPRKTLRNWMKRWDIKSAYPMPYQLKQAAEKKKKERHSRAFKFEKD